MLKKSNFGRGKDGGYRLQGLPAKINKCCKNVLTQILDLRELPTFTVNPVLPKFRLGGKNSGKNPGKAKKTNQHQQRAPLLGNLHSAASERNNRIRNRNPGQRLDKNQVMGHS